MEFGGNEVRLGALLLAKEAEQAAATPAEAESVRAIFSQPAAATEEPFKLLSQILQALTPPTGCKLVASLMHAVNHAGDQQTLAALADNQRCQQNAIESSEQQQQQQQQQYQHQPPQQLYPQELQHIASATTLPRPRLMKTFRNRLGNANSLFLSPPPQHAKAPSSSWFFTAEDAAFEAQCMACLEGDDEIAAAVRLAALPTAAGAAYFITAASNVAADHEVSELELDLGAGTLAVSRRRAADIQNTAAAVERTDNNRDVHEMKAREDLVAGVRQSFWSNSALLLGGSPRGLPVPFPVRDRRPPRLPPIRTKPRFVTPTAVQQFAAGFEPPIFFRVGLAPSAMQPRARLSQTVCEQMCQLVESRAVQILSDLCHMAIMDGTRVLALTHLEQLVRSGALDAILTPTFAMQFQENIRQIQLADRFTFRQPQQQHYHMQQLQHQQQQQHQQLLLHQQHPVLHQQQPCPHQKQETVE